MTPLQAQMLRSIATSDYTRINGSEPMTLDDVGDVWTMYIIETNSDKGVFTSLMNAGWVSHGGDTVCLTQSGFDAYKSIV